MKPALQSVLALIIITLVFTSCSGGGPKEARFIPKSSSAVIILDPGAMQDKLTKGGISIDSILSRIFKKDSTDARDKEKINELRTNAGMNWQSQFFFFVAQKRQS